MKVSAFDHPKIHHLAHLLQTELWQARGLMESIWIVTSQFAIRGNIGHLRNQAIACKINYKGDADHMVRCLVDAGWLEEHPEHRLVVHDWHEHALPWVKGRLKQDGLDFVGNGPSSSKSISSPIPLTLPGNRALSEPSKKPLRDPVPHGTSEGEAEPFEDVIGPGCEPHGEPSGPLWDALVRHKGSPAVVSAKLRQKAEGFVDNYGLEAVVKMLDRLTAEGKPSGDLGFALAEAKKQEYSRGKSTDPEAAAGGGWTDKLSKGGQGG